MSGGRLQLRFLILASLIYLALSPCLVGQTQHHRVKKQEAAIPAPVAPPVALTPAQMPASPPTVAFSGGQLTITAPNSTLGDILREVRKQTGASIDIPGNANERVMGIFGPGPARDVLSAILNGSHFNYVLLGSATNPNALDQVMLLSKPAAEPGNPPANEARMQNPPAVPAAGAQTAETTEFGNDESAEGQQDTGDIFGNADEQPNQAQQAEDQQQGQPNPFGNPGNQVKTPQQLLQELQQQQQQGQQNPNGFPNPGGPRFGGPGIPGIPPQPNPQQQ